MPRSTGSARLVWTFTATWCPGLVAGKSCSPIRPATSSNCSNPPISPTHDRAPATRRPGRTRRGRDPWRRTGDCRRARPSRRVRLRDRAEQPNGRTLRDRPSRNDRGDRRPDAGRRRRRQGSASRPSQTHPGRVARTRIEDERGRLDILVNDIFGGDRYAQWDKPLWEHDLAGGLRMLRLGVDTHLITSALAIPLLLRTGAGLLIEVNDGTTSFNANYRPGVGFYYDLVKTTVDRIVKSLDAELGDHPVTALGVTPGWLRSEQMLDNFGVTEDNWRDALVNVPGFAISETPTYLGRGLAALAADPRVSRFAGQVLTSRQLADEYNLTDIDGSRPDCWGYIDAYGIEEQSGRDVDLF